MTFIQAARWLLAPERRKRLLAAITVAVLIAALVSCGLARKDARRARTEAEVAQAGATVLAEARRSDEAALGQREASHDAIELEAASDRIEIDGALASNPDWANQPVPPAVLDSLRK